LRDVVIMQSFGKGGSQVSVYKQMKKLDMITGETKDQLFLKFGPVHAKKGNCGYEKKKLRRHRLGGGQ